MVSPLYQIYCTVARDGFMLLGFLDIANMGVVDQSIKSEIHFSDSENHNAVFSLHKETIEGRDARGFADSYSPNTLIVELFEYEHLVKKNIGISFENFRDFFGFSPDEVETSYVLKDDAVHEDYDPYKIEITDFDVTVEDPFNVTFDNGFEAKVSANQPGSSMCDCCGRRRPQFMITNGPDRIYIDEKCFKRMQAVYDVIRKVNSDCLTRYLI